MVRDIRSIRRDPLAYLARAVTTYGDLVAFPMPRTPVLLVNEPEAVQRVLVDNARGYSKATAQYTSLAAVTGQGLLTADGDAWRRRRRLLQPAFHHDTLNGVAGQAVAAGRSMVQDWTPGGSGAADPAADLVVDVEASCLRATLQVLGRTLVGADLRTQGDTIVAAVDEALRSVIERVRLPQPRWLPTPTNRRLDRAIRTLDQVCAEVVRTRRAPGAGGDDLLSLLLAASDGTDAGLSDAEVRDELVTLVIAGHETVAAAATWTLWLLATHPEHQRRLHDELDATLIRPAPEVCDSEPATSSPGGGEDRSGRRDPVLADLPRLRYTQAVVDEALRLYPPAWVVSRRALADDVIGGLAVPAGTLVIMSPWLLHRHEDHWQRPEVFEPMRFLAERTATPRSSYLPFGLGPRLCIGRDFARVELVLMLATVLRDHGVAPAPGHRPQAQALVTLRPRDGLHLIVRPH